MIDPVSKKEVKKLTTLVKQMQGLRKQNLLTASGTRILEVTTFTLSALASVNAYISATDSDYIGFLSDADLVSFAWPVSMQAFDRGFRWVVPKPWRTVTKKQNLYQWAYREVYQGANELFTRRLPNVTDQEWLKVAYIRKHKMTGHAYQSLDAEYQGQPIVVVWRKSTAGGDAEARQIELV